MANQENWRQEYLDLATRQEEAQRVHAEQLSQLARAIVHLCIAASGFEPLLDQHLGQIRRFARKQRFRELIEQVGALDDALLRQEESAPPAAAPVTESAHARLVAAIEQRGAGIPALAPLIQRLREQPEQLSADDIDRLLDTLAPRARQRPAERLAELLKNLEWPRRIEQDLHALRERLLSSERDDAWESALEQLAELLGGIAGEADQQVKATEDLLTQVTSQLKELDRYVSGARDARQASLKSGQRLGRAVDDEMRQMHAHAASGNDLAQLREQLDRSLATIRRHVRDHLAGEHKRHAKTERLENDLRQRTQHLERELAQVREQLREAHHRARQDAVTGIPNRMAYEERLEEEYKRWRRHNHFLVLMLWDIDDFKKINDRFGHQAGDKTLRIIARILESRIRETDFIGRYGGEEIATLLVGSPLTDARKVAEEMRHAIETSGFHSGGRSVRVTVSCGISEFRSGDTPDQVFERADAALYQAKAEGKNRCIVH